MKSYHDRTELMIKEFLVESFENLSTISEEITRLEKKPDDKELLNEIYRKVHTVKGSASFLKFTRLQEITHSMENLLDLIRDGSIEINPGIIDILLSGVDAVTEILKLIEKNRKEGGKQYSDVLENLLGTIEKHAMPQEKQLMKDTNVFDPPLKSEEAEKSIKESLEEIVSSDQEKEWEHIVEGKIEKGVDMDTGTEMGKVEEIAESDRKLVDSVVRVDVNLLDKMMNIVGELVLNRNQILQFSNSRKLPELHRLSQQLNIITSELQADIMTTRMQPIGSILNKFERIVRDMAKEERKKINLKIEGKDTELDRTLLEAIKDPLTHIVRNAVDHAVEPPDERIAKGKPEAGLVVIKAYHEGGQVSIEIKDDGRGISREKIIAKGIQKGLVTPDQAARMTDKQAISLIFIPAFSTAEKVTNISGRGVGMDVVKTNVEKIGGSVDVESVEAQGSTFKLRIPLTLAIVPALIVKGDGESFAIPQTNILELVHLEGEKKMKLIEKVQSSEFFRLRGNLIPILRLNHVLCLNGAGKPGEQSEESDPGKSIYDESSANIVILSAEGCVYGLIVDSILDTEEIVVKPLSKQLKELMVFAGATIMGDGSVALIIDAVGFANMLKLRHEKKEENSETTESHINENQQEILLFRIFGSSLYGVPLTLVNRLEEFQRDKIEITGDQQVIRYRDRAMPLIHVGTALNLKTGEGEENADDEVIPVFVVLVRNHCYGLTVGEILDIAVTEDMINSDAVDREGILGTVFIDGRTVTLLDVYSILESQHIGAFRTDLKTKKSLKQMKTILIAEDNAMFRKMSCSLLEDHGYKVFSSTNGQEALELLAEKKVDLVLSDIVMPKLDGLGLARAIRKDEKLCKLPLIALSTKASEREVAEGMEAGFECYLEKFNKLEILDAVGEFLN